MNPPHIILASSFTGLGRVSATTALPLFASCQLEVAVLPTVVLSSHTGGFSQVYRQDMTASMQAFLGQWQSSGVDFSALVTGYLPSSQQVELLIDYADERGLSLIVDPIMGDRGQLYAGFDESFLVSMRRLASKADLLLPNLTEACFLLERPYPDQPLAFEDYRDICLALHALGGATVVLTGVELAEERVGVAVYDGKTGDFQLHSSRRFPQHFYGTGDMVTALLASSWVQGVALSAVLPAVLDFLDQALERPYRCIKT